MTNERPPCTSCCAGATSADQQMLSWPLGGWGGLRLGETLDQILMCLHIKRSHINNSGIVQGSVKELRGDSWTLACGLGSISQDK